MVSGKVIGVGKWPLFHYSPENIIGVRNTLLMSGNRFFNYRFLESIIWVCENRHYIISFGQNILAVGKTSLVSGKHH
jgi:hypothetical protein